MTNRLQQLLALLEAQPQDAFLLFALAKEYEKTGQLYHALHTFQDLETHHPNYVGLYYHLAALYTEVNNLSAAEQTYLRGIEVAQRYNDGHALAELKNAYTNLKLSL